MTKLYIRGLNIFVVLSQIMNVVGVYEKHFFVVVFYVLKELNRHNKKDSALIKSVTNVLFGHNCCSLMVLDPLCPIPIKKGTK